MIIKGVQYMEEHLKYILLGQQRIQSLEQIFNFQPLLTEEQIKLIRLPLEMRRFKVNLKVLHVCIYYALTIDKSISSERSAEFREKCLAQISNYYIKKKMNFELYEYGYVCSRILSLALEKVLHIIYYMVYARLASRPYVRNLIAQHQNKPRNNRKYTVRSDFQGSLHSKSMDSRHFTVFLDNNQLQIDVFRKDLKKVLNSTLEIKKTLKKNDNKRYFNLTKVYPDEQEYSTSAVLQQQNPFVSDGFRKGISIPLKVGPKENSSVISRLKLASSKTEQHQGSSFKKIQLRRQKFNQQFDCGKKYETLQREEAKQLKKTGCGTMRAGEDDSKASNAYRLQKHPFEYFSNMASTIKSNNKELDYIRSQCTSHIFKKMALRQNDWNRQNKQADLRFKISQENYRHHTQPLQKEISMENSANLHPQLCSAGQQEKQLQRLQMFRDQSNASDRQQDPGIKDLITRKANVVGDDEKLLLFGKKMKNKFKVQKYKEQFRHFLKTQMFQRVRSFL